MWVVCVFVCLFVCVCFFFFFCLLSVGKLLFIRKGHLVSCMFVVFVFVYVCPRQVTVKFEVAGAPEGSKPRSMRKFYRFSVMDPISIASTCTAIRGGNPLVELQLTNTTQVGENDDGRRRDWRAVTSKVCS